MTTTKPLTGPLLDSGARAIARSGEHVSGMFERYGVKAYGVYVDHTTVAEELPDIAGCQVRGCYTFDLLMAGRTFNGAAVKLIGTNDVPDDVDGWLVASTSRAAAFSLAHALKQTDHEQQTIVRLYGGQSTEISAYMDVFSGETETVIYLNHYFDRKYRIVFPIEVRYAFCACDGTVRQAGQRIIRPGEVITFDTAKMELGDFEGYIRVDLEVENLQVRVQPFIHFWADYISAAGMCRNHQSGWSPWPPNTVFNRGHLPVDGAHDAIVSIYNENDVAVEVRALLHYTDDGQEQTVERTLQPVAPGAMSYQNISDLFGDVKTSEANAAYVLLTCDHPLHRPNYYIAKKGTRQFIDTFHQTGGKACHWAVPSYTYDKRELDKLRAVGIPYPWALDLPILPKALKIETFLGLLSLTLCDAKGFGVDFFDEKGQRVSSQNFPFDAETPIFTNVNAWAQSQGVDLPNGGMVRFRAPEGADAMPHGTAVMFGLKHQDFPNLSTSFVGSLANQNIPHYLQAAFPKSREYVFSPLGVSDHFSPGTCNDAFDSFYVVQHSSLAEGYDKPCTYRLDIFDEGGRQYCVHRTVAAQTFDAFWLSDVLKQAGITDGGEHYTLWVKSYDTKLKPYHLLVRKSDHAMSMDDASEGTLQKDPQIGGLEGEKSSIEAFLQAINRTEIAQHIPDTLRAKIRRALLSR